jgi:electron transfer flavoprotein beta subunit
MSYEIAVCLKQVPDPLQFSKVKLDPKTGTIIRTGIPSVINPLDLIALECALRIKEKYGGRVTVVSMGPFQAKEALEVVLAMGADEAVLLSDRKFAGADSLVTAEILAKGIKAIADFNLILCGDMAVDGATGQVPAQLAEYLGYPHLTHVEEFEIQGEKIKLKTTREAGFGVYEAELPLVVAFNKYAGSARNMTVKGIMRAVKHQIKIVTSEDVQISCSNALDGSPTRVLGMEEVSGGRTGLIINEEDSKLAVQMAVEHLRKLGAV